MSKFKPIAQFFKSVMEKFAKPLNDKKIFKSSETRNKVHIEVINHLLLKYETLRTEFEQRFQSLEKGRKEMSQCLQLLSEREIQSEKNIQKMTDLINGLFLTVKDLNQSIVEKRSTMVHEVNTVAHKSDSDYSTDSYRENQNFSSLESVAENSRRNIYESTNDVPDHDYNRSDLIKRKRSRKPSARSIRYRNDIYIENGLNLQSSGIPSNN